MVELADFDSGGSREGSELDSEAEGMDLESHPTPAHAVAHLKSFLEKKGDARKQRARALLGPIFRAEVIQHKQSKILLPKRKGKGGSVSSNPSLKMMSIFLTTINHAQGKNYSLLLIPETVEIPPDMHQSENVPRSVPTLPNLTIMNTNILKICP